MEKWRERYTHVGETLGETCGLTDTNSEFMDGLIDALETKLFQPEMRKSHLVEVAEEYIRAHMFDPDLITSVANVIAFLSYSMFIDTIEMPQRNLLEQLISMTREAGQA